MNPPPKERWLKYLICFLLAAITCAAFASVAGDAFIALDDRDYIIGNFNIQHGFSWASIKWALTGYYSSNWHPITWLSHMLDFQLYHFDPSGPHLTNLAFHVANIVLLFLLLHNITSKLWPSAFIALLFGIHPMHVESVAWVSERKDVLSAFFFLLTLLAYARYVELSRAKKSITWAVLGAALLLFALGLMAKPMLVTLPGILFLLDYWPLRRFQLPFKSQPKPVLVRLLIEKIPFALLSVLSCCITYFVQNATGAVKLATLDPLMQRVDHIPVSYSWYVLKCFWPVNLLVYNRLPYNESAQPIFWGTVFIIAITTYAVMKIRKYPWFFVGWFWYLGMLVPVIGLVQVGNQAYADRYTYLPYIGLFFIITWAIPEILAKWPYRSFILWPAALSIAAICFWRTTAEVRYWQNGISLFNHAIAIDPTDEMAWLLLGLEYEVHGNNDKAIECETKATEIDNQFNLAWRNLGHMLALKGDYTGAIDAYNNALACAWYSGDKINLYADLGDAYMATGKYDEAIVNYQGTLQLLPDQPIVQKRLAQCFSDNQQTDQAIAAYQDYLNTEPDDREAHLDLAMLLGGAGHDAEAIPHYQKVIELDTNVLVALNNLAWILAADSDPHLRDGKAAIPLAQHACEQTHYDQAFLIGTLAAAYAESGQFDQAVAMAQKAHDVALAHGQKGIAESNVKLLQLYKSGHAIPTKPQPQPSKPSP